jgi:hypothetical protein
VNVSNPSSKTVTVCVKVSPREAAILKMLAGSPGKGLRWLLNRHLPDPRIEL